MENLYITCKTFPDGEMIVEGHTKGRDLVFGFRTREYWNWQKKARDYTPPKYIAVFGSKPIHPTPADPDNDQTPPTCHRGCQWRQKAGDLQLQRNALRIELLSMVSQWRCGWNILPGRKGGHPDDYAACRYQ